MRLVIGGQGQGKLGYVSKKHNWRVENGKLPDAKEADQVIINHFHLWVKQEMEIGNSPEEMIVPYLEQKPDCIIICDEIGNGLVPMDAFERDYRERTGRILIQIAEASESVERILCGMGQKIK